MSCVFLCVVCMCVLYISVCCMYVCCVPTPVCCVCAYCAYVCCVCCVHTHTLGCRCAHAGALCTCTECVDITAGMENAFPKLGSQAHPQQCQLSLEFLCPLHTDPQVTITPLVLAVHGYSRHLLTLCPLHSQDTHLRRCPPERRELTAS